MFNRLIVKNSTHELVLALRYLAFLLDLMLFTYVLIRGTFSKCYWSLLEKHAS